MVSGHYVTMLVEGEAVWIADDGRCPEVHRVPEQIKKGAVMIGNFEPPPKKARHSHQEIEFLYANITQWTKDVKEWMIQQDHSIVMMVETHLHGQKLEGVHNDLRRHRWHPTLLGAHETANVLQRQHPVPQMWGRFI